MNDSPIRVLLADDQALVRAGFRLVLEHDAAIEVVAEAVDGAQAVRLIHEHRPDVVLMDIRMPGLDGIEATREIVGQLGADAPTIVVLTTFETEENIADALRAGASGFLLKDIEPDELRSAIRIAADGGGLLAPSVTRTVIEQFARRPDHRPDRPERIEVLTDREREVLALVARGLSNDEIGTQLFMSPATAKTHVSRAMSKLAARTRAELVVVAYETGFVGPST